MDYTNDILARLQRGEDVNSIATELTKSINDANTRYKAEIEAKRKAEEETKRKDKIKVITDIIAAFEAVLAVWDLADRETLDEIEKLDVEELVDELDKAMPAIQEYVELMDSIRGVRPAPVGVSPTQKASSPIDDFLNKYVR